MDYEKSTHPNAVDQADESVSQEQNLSKATQRNRRGLSGPELLQFLQKIPNDPEFDIYALRNLIASNNDPIDKTSRSRVNTYSRD